MKLFLYKGGLIMIWFSSDLHFNHDKDFCYGPRGFQSIEEMNTEIIKRWNSPVLYFAAHGAERKFCRKR